MAVPETVPASLLTTAVTVASPVLRKVVTVVVRPVLGEIFPTVGGVSDHAADTGTMFPYESVTTAESETVDRVRTIADGGATETEATGPGVTVTVCVPLVAPCADAVNSGLPACVSR